MSRIIPFDGVHNFRDFGDYPAARSKRVRRGALYRSAHHARASEADLEALEKLNLSVIVDLRRPNERARDPNRRWRNFATQVIDNDIDDLPAGEDPYYTFLRNSDLSPAQIRDWNLDYYREAPFTPRHIDLFKRYFQALGEANGPVLIHCAIGRDRTGILAALTLHLLGVARDDILGDYLLTNESARHPERTPDLFKFVEKVSGRPPSPETVHALAMIETELLEAAFATIAARHGGIDRYLADGLGVDARLRAAIEHKLLD